ncbi:unnamed protein product [Phytophthora lilii]|uniref:Unnamed protein product n=1 Tax=Phytophthora lilii TaxID=2077276 RepID=A0A9W6YJZ1_9STRA|nr:unnamed protein product [Phytophthora lilii]
MMHRVLNVITPGGFNESKHYFSNKHKLYGYKAETSVVFPGRVVFLTTHVPGSVSDITILANHVEEHKAMLMKTNQELLSEDNGEDANQSQELWGLLADKGYQGAGSMLRCIHPKKKPKNGELTADELVRNGNVSSDRVRFWPRVHALENLTVHIQMERVNL